MSKSQEIDEPDRIPGQAHPREVYTLSGQDEALSLASRQIRSGRPPQAWLIAGPPGIGKATLAYRIARYLLRYGANAEGPEDLSVPPGDRVSRQVEAGSHSGLLVLRRQMNEKTGKLKTVLDVDEIRRLGGFFGLTAGAGGWRVAIIDSADEMSDQAANALLKVLEEPPLRGMLLLIGHAPGRLLPTIRSRCQRLNLKPLPEAVLTASLQELVPDMSPDDRVLLARLSEGSLGMTLRLANENALAIARDAQMLLSVSGAPDMTAILAVAERITRATDGLTHFGQLLENLLSQAIRQRAMDAKGDERAVQLWEQTHALYARAIGLHLEPRQTVLNSAIAIAEAKRRQVFS